MYHFSDFICGICPEGRWPGSGGGALLSREPQERSLFARSLGTRASLEGAGGRADTRVQIPKIIS